MACAVSGWSRRRQGLQLEQGERTGAGAFNGGSRLSGIKNAKFKHPVLPGDTLEIECAMTKNRGAFYFAEGKGSVNGKVCVQAEFSFALVKPEE